MLQNLAKVHQTFLFTNWKWKGLNRTIHDEIIGHELDCCRFWRQDIINSTIDIYSIRNSISSGTFTSSILAFFVKSIGFSMFPQLFLYSKAFNSINADEYTFDTRVGICGAVSSPYFWVNKIHPSTDWFLETSGYRNPYRSTFIRVHIWYMNQTSMTIPWLFSKWQSKMPTFFLPSFHIFTYKKK